VQIPFEFNVIICGGIALVVLIGILGKLRGRRSRSSRRGSSGEVIYSLRGDLLSRAETVFLRSLEEAVGNSFRIAMKVRLGDLVAIPGYSSRAVSARNQVNQKHVDFVLCTVLPVTPVLAIELDDSSHDAPDRQARDELVDACLGEAGLPILHVKWQREYDVNRLAADIRRQLA
jgi:hypothetical protein